MTNTFYTNVQVWGNKILYRGLQNGQRVNRKVEYNPTIYTTAQAPTKFTDIHGGFLAPVMPGGIRETRDFIKQYKDVSGFPIFGNTRFEYEFIAESYPNDIDWDISHVRTANIDIEVGSENGFPEPEDANEPVTAITYKIDNKVYVFACGNYVCTQENVTYYKCMNELDLLRQFIQHWSMDYPDIMTGWNIKLFDIPYLVNRITKLLGEDEARRLSPWGIIQDREVNFGMGRKFKTYIWFGISALDYIDMYQRYAPDGKSQDSYKLDSIAHVELGERKLSYEEYGNLNNLYKENFQMFIDYNIKDVELVERIDDKLKLIELVLTLAYDSKTNYEDAFTQVRMWDVLITNFLRKQNIIVSPNTNHSKLEAYEGAYVKEPLLGMHNWVASFDLNSLYPHLIMQYNISPDTLIEPKDYSEDMSLLLANNPVDVESLLYSYVDFGDVLAKNNVTITPNSQFFRKDKQGFLPKMMEEMYNDRTVYKKKSIAAKKELEVETDSRKRFEIEKRIARYNNLQLAKKVCLNSAYGALGNEWFRFFDIRQALAITTGGQLSIRWIERKLNDYINKLLKAEGDDYVIAVDTDSVYLVLDKLIRKTILEDKPDATIEQVITFMDKVCENKIQPFIDKSYQELATYVNAFAQKMQMKREALADKAIWTAKKRYILNVYNNEGVQYAKPKIKVMGLEVKKSSTPAACRTKLEEAIEIIMNGDEQQMIDFIVKFREEFKTLPESEIAFPRGVNGLTKYKNTDRSIKRVYADKTPIHVRGSLIYNDLITKMKLNKVYPLIKEGEKIKFIYLREPNMIHSDIISFIDGIPKEFDIHKYIDYNTQYDKSFVEPLKIILDSIGWKTEHVNTLASFFS